MKKIYRARSTHYTHFHTIRPIEMIFKVIIFHYVYGVDRAKDRQTVIRPALAKKIEQTPDCISKGTTTKLLIFLFNICICKK